MKTIHILILTFAAVTFSYCNRNSIDKKTAFKGYGMCDSIPVDPQNYKSLCECVKLNRLTFPMSSVLTGKIVKNKLSVEDYYKNGFFKKGDSFEIDAAFLSSFKVFTADSTNFMWGELGTTYTDYIIEFYDSNRALINQADISYDGMVKISPEFGITKWGLLTARGDSIIKNLMNNYTTEKKD
jgi:hypothetical protein